VAKSARRDEDLAATFRGRVINALAAHQIGNGSARFFLCPIFLLNVLLLFGASGLVRLTGLEQGSKEQRDRWEGRADEHGLFPSAQECKLLRY
jgi:hypothetical protein